MIYVQCFKNLVYEFTKTIQFIFFKKNQNIILFFYFYNDNQITYKI